MKESHRLERLKDRRDYRAALVERRQAIDAKIKATEQEIHDLKQGNREAGQ